MAKVSPTTADHWALVLTNNALEETVAISRRKFVAGCGASLSALALRRVLLASAEDQFQKGLLPSADEMWSEVKFVNNTMGPARLTGSPQQSAFVQYLKDHLTNVLHPAGGSVFEEIFANYPRWTAKSWALFAGSRKIPVASYFPYCTGGFTGARSPLVPAPSLAAAGSGGNYPLADGSNVVLIPPKSSATGSVVNLGAFKGPGSINWAQAAGKIAYIDVSIELLSSKIPASIYTVNGTYDKGAFNTEKFFFQPVAIATIIFPPDITNATKAGVLGVILGWQGISNGNAEGQYNPFTVPYSSSPASSQAGSNPSQTIGGIPALWVTEDVGTLIKREIAGKAVPVTVHLDAEIRQVSTSTVWGVLPGANFGKANDEFLILATHSDGANIAEENAGIGLFNVAQYFARLPQRERPKSMVFMVATGHFGHGFFGAGGTAAPDWIRLHPQIINQTVGCMTIEHFGCNEWEDIKRGSTLLYEATGKLLQSEVIVTDPAFQKGAAGTPSSGELPKPGPADPTLLEIFNDSIARAFDRVVVLSGGVFSGEGGAFHAVGVPTIGYIPNPQYLCAIAPDGEISKLDSKHFHDQVVVTVKCLSAMQKATADQLKGK